MTQDDNEKLVIILSGKTDRNAGPARVIFSNVESDIEDIRGLSLIKALERLRDVMGYRPIYDNFPGLPYLVPDPRILGEPLFDFQREETTFCIVCIR